MEHFSIAYLLLAFTIGFAATYISVPQIFTISVKKKLFDIPDQRKLNKTIVPNIGGMAIFIGWMFGTLLCLQSYFVQGMQYLLVAILVMFVVGIKDDIVTVSAYKKLLLQIGAALILVILGDFKITQAYGLLGIYSLNEWFSIPLSIVIVLYLVNAINFIDGIDGLLSCLAIITLLFTGIWFFLSGITGYAIICISLTGCLFAFLRFNLFRSKYKMFMGDTGSLILGIFLSAMAIHFTNTNQLALERLQFSYPPLIALALLIIPITDTLRVFFIRIRNKRSPFIPDMNHLHHILIRRGMTHLAATCFLCVYTIFFIIVACLLSYFKLGINLSVFLLLALSFLTIAVIYTLSRAPRCSKTISPKDA